MTYIIEALERFKEQVKILDEKSKRIIEEKIQLIKENPFRFKKIHSEKYSRVFRIRLKIKNQETRLIYVVLQPKIILVCLLERKKDYKDLEKYLNKI
ncbi:hypothetical protein HYT56_04795 [Candidatus Woesearchaeota archaeon]|nr:hypothetical protein [Candidatus Woesearchaeota archaeon]